MGKNAEDLLEALRASEIETQLSVLQALWHPALVHPDRTLTLTSRLTETSETLPLPTRAVKAWERPPGRDCR